MHQPGSVLTPLPLDAALAAMAAALEDSPALPASPARNRFHRIEFPLDGVEPLDWLRAQRHLTQYYWADRANEFAMAGVGEADILQPESDAVPLDPVFVTMRRRLSRYFPSLRYYGGFRFTPAPRPQSRWRAFKHYRFIVPQFEVVRRARGTFFACNLLLSPDEATRAERVNAARILLQRISRTAAPPPAVPIVLQRDDLPDYVAWCALVEGALESFARHQLEKVVLARETCFTMKALLDPVAVLAQLIENSPQCYHFCFHPVEDRAFIGASPERLFKRHNVLLKSEALAGTRPRGRSDREDARLAEELLTSDKELREHRLVLHTLRGHFQRFCDAYREEEAPGLMTLRHCQHLHTRIEGILKQTNIDAALLDALHPTPAVGGTPRDEALRWIDAHEPFDRGIYASPVGWVGFDGCEFCVAIRSGLIRDNLLAVYTGAGIVPGSLPSEEWDEIENKMAGFLDILTTEPG